MTRVDADAGTATTLLDRQHSEDSESDTESSAGGPRNARPRRRLRLNWADEQGPEVRRQLQCDKVIHGRDA